MVEQRLRRFQLVLAGLIFIGSVIELGLTGHWGDAVQLIPFVLSGLGLIAVIMVLLRPTRGSLLGLRIIMGLVALGSLFGIYEHIEHNLAFALEIQPNAIASDVFLEALGGANPLLAPGILALGAIIALAATYFHPALGKLPPG